MVATWYGLDPNVVDYNWTMPDFLEREEFMWLRNEYRKDPEAAPYRAKPGETIATPPVK